MLQLVLLTLELAHQVRNIARLAGPKRSKLFTLKNLVAQRLVHLGQLWSDRVGAFSVTTGIALSAVAIPGLFRTRQHIGDVGSAGVLIPAGLLALIAFFRLAL